MNDYDAFLWEMQLEEDEIERDVELNPTLLPLVITGFREMEEHYGNADGAARGVCDSTAGNSHSGGICR